MFAGKLQVSLETPSLEGFIIAAQDSWRELACILQDRKKVKKQYIFRIFRGIVLRWVSLPAVWYCAESSHFLKLLHRPLKGQCHKKKCGFLFYLKRLHFVFSQKVLGQTNFAFPQYHTVGSQFFWTLKFENLLTHWSEAQAGLNDEKKLEVKKFRWTVLLRIVCHTGTELGQPSDLPPYKAIALHKLIWLYRRSHIAA